MLVVAPKLVPQTRQLAEESPGHNAAPVAGPQCYQATEGRELVRAETSSSYSLLFPILYPLSQPLARLPLAQALAPSSCP